MKNAYAVLTRSGGYFEVYAWSFESAQLEAEIKLEGSGDTIKKIKRLLT